ncbi:LysM peptidoglycan-binding domain-containing protein [Ilumatobacter coccineus]|uniref:LysM domain-containing protein n=1 Tax=Ilumatobacter coccineus (strain NBRC 103263 / KCTC 29153 / YM16-304) TaxID=1313172 RepID=A0A6C7E490_ILUCY|nr:LysM domain-containing protein [Ilumatobacter coccineus]BAN01451.1 hypothetical protein YM304_11370 [Ilumatobacter coccineus YM16-304]
MDRALDSFVPCGHDAAPSERADRLAGTLGATMNTTRLHAGQVAAFAVGLALLASCGSDGSTSLDTVAVVGDAADDLAAAGDDATESAEVVEAVVVDLPTYTIVAGDTLSGIAERAGITLGDLVAANDWADGIDHLLQPGDVILLPQGAAVAPAGSTVEAGVDSTSASAGDAAADTTYLDLFLDQGILYNPFSGDAVGGDIFYVEPECNAAVTNLSSFTAARDGVDAASMLASLEAAAGDVPANFAGALAEWQGFIADHSATYAGPFLPVSRGQLDEATLRTVLVDPAVVDMLDAFTSLELRMPDDYITFLGATCTHTGA